MTIYNLGSAPNTPERVAECATWINGFSSEEVDRIVDLCEATLPVGKATIGGTSSEEDYEEIRKSKTGWLAYSEDTAWIYDRLSHIVTHLNAKFWQYDLTGFREQFQFTLYDEADSHYTWHVDTVQDSNLPVSIPRKLSMVMQLSDPIDYDGGELQLKTGPIDTTIQKEKGLVVAFPSHTLHRVTPVKKGIRKSLVVWISGPPFK